MTNTLKDPRIREFVMPTRIVWKSVSDQIIQNSECLLRNNTGQATLNAPDVCTINYTGDQPGILLDFGMELNGGIQIVIGQTNRDPLNVRIRFGESVSEAMGEPNNDHANHDLVFPLRQWGVQEAGNTGFRFVRIDFLDEGGEAHLIAVRAVSLMRPLEQIGSFHCSDDRLNKIWQTGARTVHLCMQDYVWDGIKRDRLVWIGDMHPETQVISAVFGKHQIVPDSLDYVRDSTPLPNWMNGISSYSIWWVVIQRDWFKRWGDVDYLKKQHLYLNGLAAQLATQIDADGSELLEGFRFLDWPTQGNDIAIHAGLHALLLMAIEAAGELFQVLGDDTNQTMCTTAVTKMQQHIPPIDSSKQASSLLSLSGLYPPDLINQQSLAIDPLHGISTFYGYYVLQARAKAGDYAGCLEVIRKYWGAMLDLGATSFWEDFNLEWAVNAARIDELTPSGKVDIHLEYGDHCYKGLRHSLCHGWAAGPTAWMSEHILGVEILESGCKSMRITPHLEDLDFAEGVFPTPFGPLKIRHDRRHGGEIESEIDAPEGVHIV